MNLIIYVMVYLYITTGVCISIKLFKKPLGKILGGFYFGLFWLPLLIADLIIKGMEG